MVAKTSEIAHVAARKVRIRYTNVKKPLINIKDVINIEERVSSDPVGDPIIDGDVEEEFVAGAEVVTGEVQFGSQYHFHIETQTFLVILEKDGVRVISTTQ